MAGGNIAVDWSLLDAIELNNLEILRNQPDGYLNFLQRLRHVVWNFSEAGRYFQHLLDTQFPTYIQHQRLEQIGAASQEEMEIMLEDIKQYPHRPLQAQQLLQFGTHLSTIVMNTNLNSHVDIPEIVQAALQSLQNSLQRLRQPRLLVSWQPVMMYKKRDNAKQTAEPFMVHMKGQEIRTQVLLLCAFADLEWLANVSVSIRIISATDAVRLKNGTARCHQIQSAAEIKYAASGFVEVNGVFVSQFPEPKNEGNRRQGEPRAPVLEKIVSRAQQAPISQQKYVLLYETNLSDAQKAFFGLGDEPLWTSSASVTLISHSSQLDNSNVTSFWDRAVCKNEETDKLDWSDFDFFLQTAFKYLTGNCSRLLSPNCLRHFWNKLNPNGAEPYLTFQRFAKDPITPGGDFSFWIWFAEIATMIRNELRPYWERGYLMEFMSREEIVNRVQTSVRVPGILIRFSDTQKGMLSLTKFENDYGGVLQQESGLIPPASMSEAGSLIGWLHEKFRLTRLSTIPYIYKCDFSVIQKEAMLNDPGLSDEKQRQLMPTAPGYTKFCESFAS